MTCKKTLFLSVLVSLLLLGCSKTVEESAPEYPYKLTDLVDPTIGIKGFAHVFLGASVPLGMVQLGPTFVTEGRDRCIGDYPPYSPVIGFSHTRMSGTGIGDLLDLTVMPVTGEVTPGRGTADDPASGQWSDFDLDSEVARPGYYATWLARYDIYVELTATSRVGLHRYYFPEGAEQPAIIWDLANGGNWDRLTKGEVKQVSDTRVEGYRYSTGWAKDHRVYFAAELSTPIRSIDYGTSPTPGKESDVPYNYAYIHLAQPTEPVLLKVALSPTSTEDAWANMAAECPGWDFDSVREAADEAWEKELGRMRMAARYYSTLVDLYTALYYTLITPSDYSNADGSYLGADFAKHADPGYTTRSTFSLWDTYRAYHPLFTLTQSDRMRDIVGTMTAISREGGKVPVWHFYTKTNTMVGDPGICVLADAIVKGLCDEPDSVYQELKKTALLDERGKDLRREYGYIPYDKMGKSVAYDMEYAIADAALAEAAKHLGHEEDYTYFLKKSKSYHHLFDPVTGFMRGKGSNGEWHTPFDPTASKHRDDYCEGNAWQYTFLVPQDVEGLAGCFGGEERLIAKLDSLFSIPSDLTDDDAYPDISGLIGQYVHGNEPSLHTIYLYSVLGRQSKAAPFLRQVMTELYYPSRGGGLSSIKDAGQVSAWYLLTAIGLYQVEPAGGRYYFGSPIIDAAELSVRDGCFTIRVHDNSAENIYIQRIRLNGGDYTKRYLDYEDIARGGILDIYMGSEPRDF
ncbi:GH92 family glycosyl hydrolase [uncultured Porphyromonas sp.]|uniref:GH92 family glycosyl hydrolase n=1 Tax=uncultured Porphyromonas sp. TaxID=159274 RepID=UPI0026176D8E|nr:GH92 family glycosyl hydrolase [uncultured Porphyromonas sp.]